jgi:hypothetical protein
MDRGREGRLVAGRPVTRVLAAAVVVAQLLDLATWMAMPRAAEVNAVARGLHSTDAWLLKSLVVVLVVCLQPALRPKYAAVGEGLALLAVAAGFLGCGSNLAAISWVAG